MARARVPILSAVKASLSIEATSEDESTTSLRWTRFSDRGPPVYCSKRESEKEALRTVLSWKTVQR